MPPKTERLEDQAVPVIQIIGRISGNGDDDSSTESGTKYLVHTAWDRKTYQVSGRGLKVIRSIGVQVIDNPADYTF